MSKKALTLTRKQKKALNKVLRGVNGLNSLRFLLYGGAIRGGKTYWALITGLILCEIYPNSRWGVVRKDLSRIRGNTIPSFLKILDENKYIKGKLSYSPEIAYQHHNGSKLLFRGENIDKDRDLDKYKGFEVNGFIFEEINEVSQKMFWKAFERSGSWIIPNRKEQPAPVIMATCNPTQEWVKELIYDRWKNDTLPKEWEYIPAKISDNPYLPQAYKDSLKNLPRYEYEVYVEGNWDVRLKTGGEFLKSFQINEHIKYLDYDESETLHISIDSNVLPYIAISVWQLSKKENTWKAKKIKELPAEYPHNSARKSGKLLVKYLRKLNYNKKIYLYGDATTKAKNNIDDENRSFLTLFQKPVTDAGFNLEKRFFTKNPNVASTGEFINEIFENNIQGIEIVISEICKKTISDYIEVKEDLNGSMLKTRTKDPNTGASFEKYGHFLDTDRYFICKVFEEQFNKFRQRLTNYQDNTIPDPTNNFLSGGF